VIVEQNLEHCHTKFKPHNLLHLEQILVTGRWKIVPNRVEFWNILQNLQVVELAHKYFYNPSLEQFKQNKNIFSMFC